MKLKIITLILLILLVVLVFSIPTLKNTAPRNMVEGHFVKADRSPEELYADFPEEIREEPAGAVFNGFNIEMTAWTVCVDEAKVYSNPGEDPNWYLYSLKAGDSVTVRELDLGTRTFAAIKVANYTKFTNLCQVED